MIDKDFTDEFPKGSSNAQFRWRNRFLPSLKEDTLLIVTINDQEAFLDVMRKYRCRILFTSRCRYENLISLEVAE